MSTSNVGIKHKDKLQCVIVYNACPAPTGAPTDVSGSPLSESSIVIQWSPPELFERNGPISGYDVTLIYGNGTQGTYQLKGDTFSIQIEGIHVLKNAVFSKMQEYI